MDYLKPTTLEDAFDAIESNDGAMFIAGGTDMYVQMRVGRKKPRSLVSLRNVDELRGIDVGKDIVIGAAANVGEIMDCSAIKEKLPALWDSAQVLGSPQIRNTATLAGNLCNASPGADMAPPLYVYGAKVELRSREGTRTLDVEDFLLGPGKTALKPGEVVTKIVIPAPAANLRSGFMRKGRVKMDIAIVIVSAAAEIESGAARNVRLCAGAVAPTPVRLRNFENLLEGRTLTQELVESSLFAVQDDINPIDDVRSSAEYRRALVPVYAKRLLLSMVG
ncbi:MAG: xanthine dehydrogenase family protein subunit M [Planctomycetes bacterium]|nr:xanthine dehydrogenase family protein subunit M [Planctomycetota bacterium]